MFKNNRIKTITKIIGQLEMGIGVQFQQLYAKWGLHVKTTPPKLGIFVLVLIRMKGDFSKTENFRKYGHIRQLYRKL